MLWRHTSLLNRRVDRVTLHGMLINRFYYMKSFDWMRYSMNKGVSFLRLCSLSSLKVHAEYPNKNNDDGKIESTSLFPLPIMLRALSFLSPQSPEVKKKPLRRRVGYVHTVSDSFSCFFVLSGIEWTYIRLRNCGVASLGWSAKIWCYIINGLIKVDSLW